MRSFRQPEPMPKSGGDPVPPESAKRFLKILGDRCEYGKQHYGMLLSTFNGRDPLKDALEELVDAFQYLVQLWMERENLIGVAKLLQQALEEKNLSAIVLHAELLTELLFKVMKLEQLVGDQNEPLQLEEQDDSQAT